MPMCLLDDSAPLVANVAVLLISLAQKTTLVNSWVHRQ